MMKAHARGVASLMRARIHQLSLAGGCCESEAYAAGASFSQRFHIVQKGLFVWRFRRISDGR
jgi:hypothetical protein